MQSSYNFRRAAHTTCAGVNPQLQLMLLAGWVREVVCFPHPANMGLLPTGPLNYCGVGVRGIALFQYNNFTLCFFLSRPKDFFRHVPHYGKRNAGIF